MRRTHPFLALTAATGLTAGCSGGLSDDRFPTGSQTVVSSTDHEALYVANTQNDSVARVDVATGEVDQISVGSEPTRMARAKSRVFVSLRGERRLAILDETGGRLVAGGTLDVGPEPYGVVAREDGKRVYVAVSQAHEVLEVDAESLLVLRRWTVDSEPRWLALHPNGGWLYVASSMQGILTVVDLDSGDVETKHMPAVMFGGTERAARITGDPAVSADGEWLAVPTLHLDNRTPIDDVSTPPGGGYYGGRLGPTVTVIPVGEGRPEYDLGQVMNLPQDSDVIGYVSGVTWDPQGGAVYASVEGGRGVMIVQTEIPSDDGGSIFGNLLFGADDPPEVAPTQGIRFVISNPVLTTVAPLGARGVAFVSSKQAFVYGFIDRTVRELPVDDLRRAFERRDTFAFAGSTAAVSPLRDAMQIQVAEQVLPADLEEGQRLFYSTSDPRVSAGQSGLSCATCHFEGRNDGLSWTFLRGVRQTPSLAGQVSLTEPVRWEGDRLTVEEDARRTSRDAMGGLGMSDDELRKLADYIDWIRDVDTVPTSADPASVARGQEIFERRDVGCAGCHNGPRLTDNQTYTMFGLNVQTRSLVGLRATAPYLHDGSAPTLEAIIQRAQGGAMGDTSMLDPQERQDLIHYLETL